MRFWYPVGGLRSVEAIKAGGCSNSTSRLKSRYTVALVVSMGFAIASASQVNAQSAAEQSLNTDPAIAEVLGEYRGCVVAAATKAAKMKSAKLREKVFNGQLKGCDRSREASLGIIQESRKQEILDQDIAAITENLIAEMKKDLGI